MCRWYTGGRIHRSCGSEEQIFPRGHGVILLIAERALMPACKLSSGTTKSIDLHNSKRAWTWRFFWPEGTYSNDGWYAVDIEKIVTPEHTGNLSRVESLRNGCHEWWRNTHRSFSFHTLLSLRSSGSWMIAMMLRAENDNLKHKQSELSQWRKWDKKWWTVFVC